MFFLHLSPAFQLVGWKETGRIFRGFNLVFLLPNLCSFLLLAALVVRFLTKRFIGDYERNAGMDPFCSAIFTGMLGYIFTPGENSQLRLRFLILGTLTHTIDQ